MIAILFTGCSSRKVHTVRVEGEANQIIDVLGEYGIKSRKEEIGEGDRKTFEIWVDGDDEALATAIQLMEDHCLGQPEPPPVEGGTVITSTEVEKQREQRRMKMNIESQLRRFPGVTCVTVNFVPPQDRSLAINPYPSTASVLINYKTPTFPVSKDDVADLVAKSVPALQRDNVSVVLNSKPLRPVPDNQSGYKFTRILMVAGIGFVTILGFISIVFFLQKKRHKQAENNDRDFDEEFAEDDDVEREKDLLHEGYDPDEAEN